MITNRRGPSPGNRCHSVLIIFTLYSLVILHVYDWTDNTFKLFGFAFSVSIHLFLCPIITDGQH